MTIDERKRTVAILFDEVSADADGISELLPQEDWKDYIREALPEKSLLPETGRSERKTGVKHAEVITVRLVQDERGWLRLAG